MEDGLNVLSRFLHVFGAIVLLGGAVFTRFVLLPSTTTVLTGEEHDKLRQAVGQRWAKFVHLGIGLLLLTGFYNYLIAPTPADVWKLYHPLVGTKILLALAVFFIASGLAGRTNAFAGMRAKAGLWLIVLILLGATIVGVSGFLKVGGAKALRAASKTPAAVTQPAE